MNGQINGNGRDIKGWLQTVANVVMALLGLAGAIVVVTLTINGNSGITQTVQLSAQISDLARQFQDWKTKEDDKQEKQGDRMARIETTQQFENASQDQVRAALADLTKEVRGLEGLIANGRAK